MKKQSVAARETAKSKVADWWAKHVDDKMFRMLNRDQLSELSLYRFIKDYHEGLTKLQRMQEIKDEWGEFLDTT